MKMMKVRRPLSEEKRELAFKILATLTTLVFLGGVVAAIVGVSIGTMGIFIAGVATASVVSLGCICARERNLAN